VPLLRQERCLQQVPIVLLLLPPPELLKALELLLEPLRPLLYHLKEERKLGLLRLNLEWLPLVLQVQLPEVRPVPLEDLPELLEPLELPVVMEIQEPCPDMSSTPTNHLLRLLWLEPAL
jgi:hypothetical protein